MSNKKVINKGQVLTRDMIMQGTKGIGFWKERKRGALPIYLT